MATAPATSSPESAPCSTRNRRGSIVLNLNETVEAVLALSRGAIERQRVAVRTELADPPPLVRADPVQLQQVVINLVMNALEAMAGTPEGERVMTVRSRVEGETAAVIVEDNGAGLDPDRVAHIFDSFYTTKPGGIGVGLAISRSIIDAHGGSMWAAPGTPTGAVVGFTLPLAARWRPPPAAARNTKE